MHIQKESKEIDNSLRFIHYTLFELKDENNNSLHKKRVSAV